MKLGELLYMHHKFLAMSEYFLYHFNKDIVRKQKDKFSVFLFNKIAVHCMARDFAVLF